MKKRFSNNKGFSLVELIIVVAIMAILIGILAPQYMKYVEKSRVSADNDVIDSVRKACETAVSDPNTKIDNGFTVTFSDSANISFSGSAATAAQTEVTAIIGTTSSTKLKSKTYKNAGSKPTITVTMTDTDSDGVLDPTISVSNLKGNS